MKTGGNCKILATYIIARKGDGTLNDTSKLAKKAIRGNVDAYGQLIEQNKNYLYRTAMLYMKNEDDALDVVSECVLKGFRNIKKLKDPKLFKTWITRILINVVNDAYEQRTNVVDISQYEFEEPSSGVSREECLDLYDAIDSLSEKYKTVIILKYFSELKLSEIAYIMDIPEGSVSAYLTRAKQDLRGYLKEGYYA